MDKSLIEKYKAEMIKMQKSARVIPVNTAPSNEQPSAEQPPTEENNSSGGLLAFVTTLRTIYPIEGARITIFTGDFGNDMQVIATDTTDQSGRSRIFSLPTPEKSLSLSSGADTKPYATYNMLVQAEGYLDNIHLNIPVFSGVTSLQRSNLLLLETSGVNKGPQIFDEAQQYQL